MFEGQLIGDLDVKAREQAAVVIRAVDELHSQDSQLRPSFLMGLDRAGEFQLWALLLPVIAAVKWKLIIYRLASGRPVTPKVAGSSPVTPAIFL